MRRLRMSGLPRRGAALTLGLALLLGGIGLADRGSKAQSEELIDLTLLFHSAVQGKIAPCG